MKVRGLGWKYERKELLGGEKRRKEREGILTRAREREKEEIVRREGEERRRGNWSVSTNQDTQILKGKQTKCIINAEQ